MASESGDAPAAGGGDGYGVLMISDALGAAEVIALEKVRDKPNSLVAPERRPDSVGMFIACGPWYVVPHRGST